MNPGDKYKLAEPSRTDVTYDELPVDNIPNATTISLLRERERDLYAQCMRMFRCLNPGVAHQFVFHSKEGTGDSSVRVRNGRRGKRYHLRP